MVKYVSGGFYMIFESDGKVHHPLGGGSYVFEKDLTKYLLSKVEKDNIKISIGAQPNSSPHFGTLTVFNLAFSTAKKLLETDSTKNISVLFEVVDTAPSETIVIDGVKYQKSLKQTGVINSYMHQYVEILEYLKLKTGINYEIRFQSEFNKQKEIYPIVKNVIANRDKIQDTLDPKYGNLRVRVSCPECGLSDKNSVKNAYDGNIITSCCPVHGVYKTNIENESEQLEYNTPLRNLIRALAYSEINKSDEYDYHIMRITGSDYAGFYQEELLYKVASTIGYKVETLPTILYSPLILDWSGAKLSKSLYVKKDAYRYLPKFLINYENLKAECGFQGLDYLQEITQQWTDNPYMLFRHYSIYYFMEEFRKMNEKAIYLSIKPQFTKLIESGEKDHEFRKYIPKQDINTLYVYESAPTSALKYIVELNGITEYPEQISPEGYGNSDFNAGLKQSKYAYSIKSVYALEPPIQLEELREQFGFAPPQSYAYDDKYPELTKHIQEANKKLVLTREQK